MVGRHVTIRPVLPKITSAGDRGLIADFGPDVSAAELHARASTLRERDDIVACIAGHQSLYIVFDEKPAIDFAEVASFAFTPRTHVIDVDFAGPDLDEFLVHTRLTRDDFLQRIPSLRLTARYLGFRAGFAYLEGWPDEWRMPRRATSRNVVPRGSFAIAEVMAGFYPVDSPGGWNLLGRTNESLRARRCHRVAASGNCVIPFTRSRCFAQRRNHCRSHRSGTTHNDRWPARLEACGVRRFARRTL
jgi:KipI family sensor histidine kinase inhibitor